MSTEKTIIGWREYVSLPDWGVRRIRAKADTGARSSAIDVKNIEELPGDRVRFDIVIKRTPLKSVTCEANVVRRTHVKPSSGKGKERIFVRAVMRLGETEKEIELGLVSRRHMLCRMLIGRSALRPEFVVDTETKYRVTKRKRRKQAKR